MIAVLCTFTSPGGKETETGAQQLTRGFVHGLCVLGGKSDVGHFPSGEKYNNMRKRQALWEGSKWEFQLSLGHKQRGMTSLEVRPNRALRQKVWEPVF